MKKFAVLIAVVLVAALAAPALSATNPFMDVPMNHWAYDAIGQLYAHNIMRGYDDGLFKGNQTTTRYELASALARSLAVVDYSKASKQDVEMIKRLVVEFKDELEALGVRVDELDERVAVYENRLGGWHMHGQMEFDVDYVKANEAPEADGAVHFDNARIWFERTFGENDEYQFTSRIGLAGSTVTADRFWVSMPFFFDSRLKVGHDDFAVWEGAYAIDLHDTGSWGGDQIMTDWVFDGFSIRKNFALGWGELLLAHPNKYADSNWMIMAGTALQFTEKLGIDLAVQGFFGDNSETFNDDPDNPIREKKNRKVQHIDDDMNFKSMWEVFAGLHFNFTDNVALKGAFYHQAFKTESVTSKDNRYYWNDDDQDGTNHYRVIIDVKQPVLKYTSLWLEYGHYDAGFVTRSDAGIFYATPLMKTDTAPYDMSYYRIALTQEWNEKWATHIFYYGYNLDDAKKDKNNKTYGESPFEVGAGVQYNLNDFTSFGLNYVHADTKYEGKDDKETKDDIVKFRTKIVF